jgi:hypothetical protein
MEGATSMKTSAMMRCPKCEETSELDNLHLLDRSFKREWVGLTDEEIKPCWHEACQTDLELTSQLVVYFAKAIEAKLKEKNSA